MTNPTKVRPILMSAPMVRGLLNGSKTQTRRIVKPASKWAARFPICSPDLMAAPHEVWWHGEETDRVGVATACPYGVPGDMLYVRETWRTLQKLDCLKPGQLAHDPSKVTYDADPERRNPLWAFGKTRVSIHMPRWASRLTLEIIDIRVERLRDISEADAEAEGLFRWDEEGPGGASLSAWGWQPRGVNVGFNSPAAAYRALWEHINGEESWAENPYVWCVEFRVHHANVDQVLREMAA